MKSKAPAIDRNDGFDMVAVWEKDGRKWHLLQLARPQSAIALAQEKPKTRLVFPTSINPNVLVKRAERKSIRKNRRSH